VGVMARTLTRCIDSSTPISAANSVVVCRFCMTVHHVNWQPGWEERMDTFIGTHYEDHGLFAFTIHNDARLRGFPD
jgi:glyoxylate utilization-related uncharacterized protein